MFASGFNFELELDFELNFESDFVFCLEFF